MQQVIVYPYEDISKAETTQIHFSAPGKPNTLPWVPASIKPGVILRYTQVVYLVDKGQVA